MNFKQAILRDLVHTYNKADEIRVYEDRPKHVKAFRDYFEDFNRDSASPSTSNPRKPILAEVIHVADTVTTLDPVVETAEVQRMMNTYNTAISTEGHSQPEYLEIRRHTFYTGYLISVVDTARLTTLIDVPQGMPKSELRFLANNILITARPCPQHIREKVGGIGRKQTWQVDGIAVYESKIWAARVTPVPPDVSYHTDNPVPIVVLAVLKGARIADAGRIQNWQPVGSDKQFIFQTEVGEKVQLRIERGLDGVLDSHGLFSSGQLKRPRAHDNGPGFEKENYRSGFAGPQKLGSNEENRRTASNNGINSTFRGGNQSRSRGGVGNGGSQNRHPSHNNNRGGRGATHNRGIGNRGGRSGRGGYRSLDDVQNNTRYGNRGSSYQPNYDDNPGSAYATGSDGYSSAFPVLGGGNGTPNNGAQGNGNGGLNYGR
ncbi:MAG: hypothetical protein Q9190_003399 [Brigantiaea leucoxantha]